MPVTVTLPQLGESVTEGTITRWLKSVGDTVAADEPLVEISTDKVDTEIPAPASGVLLSIAAEEDAVVEVGGVLGVIGEPSEASQAAAPEPAPQPAAQEATPEATPEPAPAVATEPVAEAAAPAAASGGGEEVVVTLPALGESVTEGIVTRWLKSVGDTVAADEPLLEISTDKVDTEMPAPASGVLTSISVEADGTVEVGAEVARIATGAGAAAAPAAQRLPLLPRLRQPRPHRNLLLQLLPLCRRRLLRLRPAAPAAPAASGGTSDAGAYVTPLVRKLAAENDIDLSTVSGSGVGGRIRKADVLAAVEAKKSAAAATSTAPAHSAPSGGRAAPERAVAAAWSYREDQSPAAGDRRAHGRALQTSAQLTTVVEVDVTRIAALRQRVKANSRPAKE